MAIIGTSYAFSTNGVLTVNGTTPPTQAQMFYSNQLVCQLTAGDADTTCTITHNFNFSTTHLANLLPNIAQSIAGSSAGTVYPVIAYTVTSNTITVVKGSVVGSNSTVLVTISRPFDPMK